MVFVRACLYRLSWLIASINCCSIFQRNEARVFNRLAVVVNHGRKLICWQTSRTNSFRWAWQTCARVWVWRKQNEYTNTICVLLPVHFIWLHFQMHVGDIRQMLTNTHAYDSRIRFLCSSISIFTFTPGKGTLMKRTNTKVGRWISLQRSINQSMSIKKLHPNGYAKSQLSFIHWIHWIVKVSKHKQFHRCFSGRFSFLFVCLFASPFVRELTI